MIAPNYHLIMTVVLMVCVPIIALLSYLIYKEGEEERAPSPEG